MQPPPPPAAAALEVFKGSLQQQIPGVFFGVYMYIHVNLRCSRSNIKPCNRPFGGGAACMHCNIMDRSIALFATHSSNLTYVFKGF